MAEVMRAGYDEYMDVEKAAPVDLARLQKLAQLQHKAELAVAELESKLQRANEALRNISENLLPTVMQELKLETFRTTDGLDISINEIVRASIPKAGQEKAFNWLDGNGHGGMIKRTFTVSFGRDEERWASKFARDLKQRKREVDVKQDKKVENSTLRAFIREQLDAGAEIDLKMFGAFLQRVAKVKLDTGQNKARA